MSPTIGMEWVEVRDKVFACMREALGRGGVNEAIAALDRLNFWCDQCSGYLFRQNVTQHVAHLQEWSALSRLADGASIAMRTLRRYLGGWGLAAHLHRYAGSINETPCKILPVALDMLSEARPPRAKSRKEKELDHYREIAKKKNRAVRVEYLAVTVLPTGTVLSDRDMVWLFPPYDPPPSVTLEARRVSRSEHGDELDVGERQHWEHVATDRYTRK